MELGKSVAMLFVVSIISYRVVVQHLPLYPRLVLMDVRQLIYWLSLIIYQVFLRAAIFLFLLSLVDYKFQKYRFLENLKMTKQEVKDDMKMMEGNPEIKARVRRIQMAAARKRMLAAVPKATVIVTNPTHFAVALEYRRSAMAAPRVLAKGRGVLAQKIKDVAREHGVPMVENRSLAQALYKTVEIGDFIPADLFEAVAEVLAYLIRLKQLAL
jgi:flagellar biosynthetic protein FlhB